MTKLDAKTIYAQSSDIKARTYLEYRKDMKKKAIAELEILEWLENKLKKIHSNKKVRIFKAGGDKFLWFLRRGGISRKPDFIAQINSQQIEFEFQYADKIGLEFYDFKISKVAKSKNKKRLPIKNKYFVYIHKPLLKYAIFSPEWIFKNGKYGMVEAWRSYAYRVPKKKFERLLKPDHSLKKICEIIDAKNTILDFQHRLIDINKEKLSYLLQRVIDENKIVKVIPKDLDSFHKVCFILDNLNKIPKNANLWLMYLLSYIDQTKNLEEISQIAYCVDYLYSKITLKQNELARLILEIKKLLKLIKNYEQKDGSFISSIKFSPLEEIRFALFSINLIEDLIQDMIFYYNVTELKPIKKIYQNIKNPLKTCKIIKNFV